jgi:transglutaminase-like putative cysteine protease
LKLSRGRAGWRDVKLWGIQMIDRRQILKKGAALAAFSAIPVRASAAEPFAPTVSGGREFEVVTRLELSGAGAAQAWVPLPSFAERDWLQPKGSKWTTNARTAKIVRDPKYGAQMLHLVFDGGDAAPTVEVTSRYSARDRAVDPSGKAGALSSAERKFYTQGTAFIPVDGIVKARAQEIVGSAGGDEAKARAIYEWVVENAYRNPAARGCGVGDIVAMLKSGDFGGKCADINALYVGLARAVGLPAREIYGLRVAPSKFGYKSMGPTTELVTKAQHCRAEVYLSGNGWVPVDPADVRKVMLEEPPGKLPIDDAKVASARKGLFGAWEGNWIAYNSARDIALPGSSGPRIAFLMYPHAEIANARIDCLDPDAFRYVIKAKELAI